jgi:N-acetyl-anhydromuramyl-L-alanine amidase AmpD
MRTINEIIIHCSATYPNWMAGHSAQEKTNEIRRWHMQERKWSDIGYHYVIDRDGHVGNGRPVWRMGAHVRGHNATTIGLCLIGGAQSAATDKFEDHFTLDQDRVLRQLIVDLQKGYPGIKKISGHNQYAAKACPGFYVPDWYGEETKSQNVFEAFIKSIKEWSKNYG